jgi:hypothetical protein
MNNLESDRSEAAISLLSKKVVAHLIFAGQLKRIKDSELKVSTTKYTQERAVMQGVISKLRTSKQQLKEECS